MSILEKMGLGKGELPKDGVYEEQWDLESKPSPNAWFVAILIILVALGSYGLGRLSKIDDTKEPMAFDRWDAAYLGTVAGVQSVGDGKLSESSDSGLSAVSGKYVGSKNSDKYHLPWCGGAARIKEENKIWFDSKEEAEAAGYSPAGNCKGLQ